jgi:hypothetical protein
MRFLRRTGQVPLARQVCERGVCCAGGGGGLTLSSGKPTIATKVMCARIMPSEDRGVVCRAGVCIWAIQEHACQAPCATAVSSGQSLGVSTPHNIDDWSLPNTYPFVASSSLPCCGPNISQVSLAPCRSCSCGHVSGSPSRLPPKLPSRPLPHRGLVQALPSSPAATAGGRSTR